MCFIPVLAHSVLVTAESIPPEHLQLIQKTLIKMERLSIIPEIQFVI